MPYDAGQLTITQVEGGGLCLFDAGATIPDNNTVPAFMIGNTIVAGGPDDFLMQFSSPVNSVGFDLLTNFLAQETVTLHDAVGNVIANLDLDALTLPNSRQFVGFSSPAPIGSLLVITQGGARQNEGIDLLEVGSAASRLRSRE
jgi:hypothetical protein